MSIDSLLRIEITVSNIYYRLLMLEIYGEVESGEYTTNLKMLLNILKEELQQKKTENYILLRGIK